MRRNDFPILQEKIRGKTLIYLDNAASTQKPYSVIEAEQYYYEHQYSNIHRGVHHLSQVGTTRYEEVRDKVMHYIHARHREEVIFTKGTTDSINTIAYTFGRRYLKPNDEILITGMEHHSNIVPWQIVASQYGAIVTHVPLQKDGSLLLEDFEDKITSNTKLVACTWVSNALGTINPMKNIIEIAHKKGVPILVDAAQAVQHFTIDVQDLNCDFLVFSGHKMYGPTGTGILYGKKHLLDELPPFEGGGDMIKEVTLTGTTYNDLPFKFEAGTPNIAGVIGLGAAIDYIIEVGLNNISEHESALLAYFQQKISDVDKIIIFAPNQPKAGALSFLLGSAHPYDVGVLLDNQGIAIRTGHHCTQPIMDFYNIPGTCRVSFALYNTFEEIDFFIEALHKVAKMLQ